MEAVKQGTPVVGIRSDKLAVLCSFKRAQSELAYYQKKLSAFREGVAGDISINKDFGGEIVRGVRP